MLVIARHRLVVRLSDQVNGDMMVAAWTVRSGKHGERDMWCLENGLAGGGWHQVPDLSPAHSREAIADLVTGIWASEKPGAIPVYVGQLWALRERIRPDDVIVLPLKTTSQIALGRVSRGYSYASQEPDLSQRHRLHVNWIRTDVPRTAIKQDLLYSLGSAMTIFQTTKNDGAWRLEQVLETGRDPGARTGALPPASIFTSEESNDGDLVSYADLEDYALIRIQTIIQETFSGHDLTRLIAAILTADGYVCERKPPGPDGGVDILAGTGPLGLDSPRLVVQVKSDASPIGDPVVQTLQGAMTRFNAEQALLVAWGGVNKYAEKFLETTKFTIRVWDSMAVMNALFRTYPQLPEELRAEIPLKQVWIPVE